MRSLPLTFRVAAIALIFGLAAAPSVVAQEGFTPGSPLELMSNTRIFGSFHFAESCSYAPEKDLYVTPNAGNRGEEYGSDGYVSLINHDGTVHTLKWIGESREELTLNDPLGSDIVGGVLYVADRNVVRAFDVDSGHPLWHVEVDDALGFNDIAVAADGTIFATQTRPPERLYRIDPDGTSTVVVDGAPLSGPNGVAFDPDGNLVVVNLGVAEVHTFSPDGELLLTEMAHDSGNDGLVILPDGTKYVSSVRFGTVGMIPAGGGEAQVIATGIPSAASMCYDPIRHRLIVPMNAWNALAFVELD